MNAPTLSPVLSDPLVLAAEPTVVLARVVLRLTIYTDDPLTWARGLAAEVMRSYLRLLGPRPFRWNTTSRLDRYRRVDAEGLDALAGHLTAEHLTRPRHQFSFRLVDRTDAPIEEMSYREVDPARFGHAGVLSLSFAMSRDPSDLLQLALEIGNTAPFWSGVGGYAVAIHPLAQPEAFTFAHRLARRFIGLDVQDPEAMGRVARTGLPGTNWLTLIGKPLIDALPDLAHIRDRELRSAGTVVMALRRGLLVRAGERPVPGDLNELETPAAYHEIAHVLRPHFVPEVEEYPGEFGRSAHTTAFLHRLADPEGWRRA